ncbi:MAG: F0F1 ATP synthase subunit C [Candidatus Micrarchaeota archaeon]
MPDAEIVGGVAKEGLIALGAGLAILGGAIGTGLAQSSVGSSIIGVIAEKPNEYGRLLLYYLIPETLVLFGFVIAFMLFGKM